VQENKKPAKRSTPKNTGVVPYLLDKEYLLDNCLASFSNFVYYICNTIIKFQKKYNPQRNKFDVFVIRPGPEIRDGKS
jgi:hypothetical protein